MVDSSGEVDLWGLEWVVGGEVDSEEKDTSRVWRVRGAHDSSLPVEQIVTDRSSRTRRRRVTAQVCEFLVDSLERHDGLLCGGGGVLGEWLEWTGFF